MVYTELNYRGRIGIDDLYFKKDNWIKVLSKDCSSRYWRGALLQYLEEELL